MGALFLFIPINYPPSTHPRHLLNIITQHVWLHPVAAYLRSTEWGDGVSPSWYYSYTLQIVTRARRPRPIQLSLNKQHKASISPR